ncbi:MAG: gephyrin-like molybdotransferase Glp [Minicystis sp.]
MRDVRMRGFRERTSVEAALSILEQRVGALGAEAVSLDEAAGRVAAEDIVARVSVPHFSRAAMDGYALAGEATFGAGPYAPRELLIVGDSRPGRPHLGTLEAGQAVRIATGAPMPAGADAVLMAEHAGEIAREGAPFVEVREAVAPGKHVGAIGEDVREGTRVVAKGRRLRPQDLGVLASVGVGVIQVVLRPRVRVVITGDELLPPGSVPTGACIVDANSLMLAALARRDGARSIEIVRSADRRALVREAIASGDEEVVLISGGSSVGPEDHAPSLLAELGELCVHGVAMRPASPAGFGFIGEDRRRVAFLLPGNPVSCLAAYEFFAAPTIRALGGRPRAWPHARRRCRVASKIVSELGRTDYLRVAIEGETVIPIMTSGASILSSTTRADGVVIIEAGDEGHGEGEWVDVLLYDA